MCEDIRRAAAAPLGAVTATPPRPRQPAAPLPPQTRGGSSSSSSCTTTGAAACYHYCYQRPRRGHRRPPQHRCSASLLLDNVSCELCRVAAEDAVVLSGGCDDFGGGRYGSKSSLAWKERRITRVSIVRNVVGFWCSMGGPR